MDGAEYIQKRKGEEGRGGGGREKGRNKLTVVAMDSSDTEIKIPPRANTDGPG